MVTMVHVTAPSSRPPRLGVHVTDGGVEVGVLAPHAEAVELCLVDHALLLELGELRELICGAGCGAGSLADVFLGRLLVFLHRLGSVLAHLAATCEEADQDAEVDEPEFFRDLPVEPTASRRLFAVPPVTSAGQAHQLDPYPVRVGEVDEVEQALALAERGAPTWPGTS